MQICTALSQSAHWILPRARRCRTKMECNAGASDSDLHVLENPSNIATGEGNCINDRAAGMAPSCSDAGAVYHSMLYVLVGIASLGGLLFGYETGVAAGALRSAQADWNFTANDQVLLSSATLLGALVGSLSAGRVA